MLLLLSLILIGLALLVHGLPEHTVIEGFNYKTCKSRGFSTRFCLATPTAGSSTGVCKCADGADGITVKSTGARCFCGRIITDPWLRSNTPLIYDGSNLPGHGTMGGRANLSADGTSSSVTEEGKRKSAGRWWYRFTWI